MDCIVCIYVYTIRGSGLGPLMNDYEGIRLLTYLLTVLIYCKLTTMKGKDIINTCSLNIN